MKLTKTSACAICDEPLKWWSTQSCIRCHMAICKKHTCTIRRSRSSVLFSFCTNCALEAAKRRAMNKMALPGVPQHTPRTPQKSLSGISFSGFSFSGFSFSGISFSGISFSGLKREKPQSNDQPDTTATDQKQQGDRAEKPPAEQHTNH